VPVGGLAKTFCEDCGSHLFAREPESRQVVFVRMAADRRRSGGAARGTSVRRLCGPWEVLPEDGLPRFDERIPDA
jgi:hypothetical protein